MHTHAKRKLSSLSSAEASVLLNALNDCYQQFEHLDLEALDGLHDTIASLQLRLRHISFSKATENSLELCGIQAAWPPVLRSTLGQSETTPFRTLHIREPYVRKLLLGRAVWVSVLVAAFSTALTLIFWAVPGHRL